MQKDKLNMNTTNGEWVNLLRVRRSGMLSRHLHPAPVHGYVIRGAWRYLEHDWTADGPVPRAQRAAWQRRLADQIGRYVNV